MHHEEAVGIIHKCAHCGAFRDLKDEPPPCLRCLSIGVVCTAVVPLVLLDMKYDRLVAEIEDELFNGAMLAAAQKTEKC